MEFTELLKAPNLMWAISVSLIGLLAWEAKRITSSVEQLNINMAVVLSRLINHEKDIEKLKEKVWGE